MKKETKTEREVEIEEELVGARDKGQAEDHREG